MSSAVEAIRSQIAVLHEVCEGLSHRELIGLLSELTTVLRTVPVVEHRVLARLTRETDPHKLGEASWPKVLTTALPTSTQANTASTATTTPNATSSPKTTTNRNRSSGREDLASADAADVVAGH